MTPISNKAEFSYTWSDRRRIKANVTKAAIIALAFISTIIVVFVIVTWQNVDTYELCIRRSAHIFQDGRELNGVRVFKGSRGHVILTLHERPSAPYIFWPEIREVGDCNSGTFFTFGVFGLQKRARDGHYPCAGAGKQEIVQNVTYSNAALAFNRWDWTAKPPAIRRLEIHW